MDSISVAVLKHPGCFLFMIFYDQNPSTSHILRHIVAPSASYKEFSVYKLEVTNVSPVQLDLIRLYLQVKQ